MFEKIKGLYDRIQNKTGDTEDARTPDIHHALFNDLLILDGVDSFYSDATDAITTLVTTTHRFKKKQASANELAIDIANAEIAIESLKYACPALWELVPRHKVIKVNELFDYVLDRSEKYDK